jgi:predicted enzyme involved in methoxymalonyl-ACP biosynthesis
MDIFEFFGIKSLIDIKASLDSLHTKVDALMATYAESKQAWVDYTEELQTENADLRSALTDAQATAQANADALAAFQADDAATDAQQLADQEQAFADDLAATLENLKTPPAAPEPLPDEPPVVDNTLPGDQPEVNPL